MAKMLCCGGEKDTSRDLKSAQNTPSRQPMQNMQPFQGGQQQQQQPQQQQGGLAAGVMPVPPQATLGGGLQAPGGPAAAAAQMQLQQQQQQPGMPPPPGMQQQQQHPGMVIHNKAPPLMGQQQPGRVFNSYDAEFTKKVRTSYILLELHTRVDCDAQNFTYGLAG